MPSRPRPRKPQKNAADPAPAADPIPIDRAGLVETLADFAHSSAWESLRHCAQPASTADLATALGRPVTAVQRTLDALERIGIVRRLPATARSRRIRYEVTRLKIVIQWDPANPVHRALHGRLGHAFERRSAAHIADALPYDQREATRGYIDRRLFWGHFEQDDLDQIKAIVGMLDLLMARVNARHAQAGGAGAATVPPCNYHVSFAIVQIPVEFPPPALIQVDGRQNTPNAKRHRAASAFESLTAREREVFDMLLTGRSLAEIGRDPRPALLRQVRRGGAAGARSRGHGPQALIRVNDRARVVRARSRGAACPAPDRAQG